MRKFALLLLAVSFWLGGPAAGQDSCTSKSNHEKVVSLSAQVSEDGKNLIAKSGESWLVVNPGMLAGREGQKVKVKCRISSLAREVHVLSVKTLPITYAANPGDSAFRR